MPLLAQMAQFVSCWDRINSTLIFRVLRTLGLFVWTTMPSTARVLQAVTSLELPSTSTIQTRQAPILFRFFR